MKNNLRELNSGLYLLSKHNTNKSYKMMEKILTIYKTTDDVMTAFIKELNNEDTIELFGRRKINYLINLASLKLKDATNLIKFFIESDNSNHFYFLLEFINLRLNKNYNEDIKTLINEMLLNPKKLKLIEQIINTDEPFFISKINNLTSVLLKSDNSKISHLIEQILYSKKINELEINTLRKAFVFIASNKNITYEEVLEELTLNYVNNLDLLTELKEDMLNSENEELKIKGNVTNIYNTLYPTYNKKIIETPERILLKYNDEVLKSFVDTLDNPYINRVGQYNPSLDVMSSMLNINNPLRAEDIFIKSSYRPINKYKRREVFNTRISIEDAFASRLNTNINLCLNKGYYDLLLTILKTKKIDSLNIKVLYNIIVEMAYYLEDDFQEKSEVCQNIIDIILLKISTDKLFIYSEYNLSKYNYILIKDYALDFVNLIFSNPDIELNPAMEQIQNNWTTYKI